MVGGSESPISTWDGWGTPCSPRFPSPVGLARDQPILWAPHGSGLRLGPGPPWAAVPDPGDTKTQCPELPSPSALPGVQGQGSILLWSGQSRFRGPARDQQLLCEQLKGALCTPGLPAPSTTGHRRHRHRAGAHPAHTSQPAPPINPPLCNCPLSDPPPPSLWVLAPKPWHNHPSPKKKSQEIV